MKTLKQLQETYKVMKKLSKGIDPISNIRFSDYDLLNDELLKNTFINVCEFLEILEKEYYEITNKKIPFKIIDIDAIRNIVSNKPIIITEFVNKINSVNKLEKMKKLQTKDITSWLLKYGYLKEEVVNDDIRRLATKAGEQIGIKRAILATNTNIIINLYERKAQDYIINYLDVIIKEIS